ncbi:ABC transporter ATP-binding protein [Actinoplanes regularis]|uniref:Amino acid/amide ABC transporter ATP-binding protein 2, HAAT family n=1 Tax=Actinoplanes regularis TaxID=52697 RepID=A0A238Y9P2_9ACTN|nr:ABC transporter ATP-binding protein [Actinoplanes regularis]GIE86100.1 ABC transporter ATP-binding protein [Actinoplanes regularis]GLW27800.1 ABC transporter ATP-binding protein [Actinoplanes regularis]SNR67333.1 amino acid/amide ABC transporter ATP-binding protein 2, HAAT family [Actinoplanes regularis]
MIVEVRDLTVRYGAATALDGVTLSVAAGELVALIGPNGAGKSTLVNALCGIRRPASGRIDVRGRLALVPEGRHLFPSLSVDDNLRLGAWRRRERDTAHIYALLPELTPLRDRPAGRLSGGEQQMVALGRALMSRPDLLVIDEMSLGLAPKIVGSLVAHLRQRNAEDGLAVLLIEQNARLALELCTRAYVLEAGRVVAEGPAAALAGSPEIAAAYLGLEA